VEPPSIFLRLRNTTDKRLFCVLLDLTDRHRMHAELFPGAYIAAHWAVPAGGAGPITLTLPPNEPVTPGASVTDWLVLLVAEEEFNSDPFSLPACANCPRPGPRRSGYPGSWTGSATSR